MSETAVVILCAGLGTRLRPLTSATPKPAVPLFGRPLVAYSMAAAKAAGFTRVCLNTHWRPEVMEAAASEAARGLGLDLSVSYEPEILGTGGALRRLRDERLVASNATLLVLNGDVLCDADLGSLLREHDRSGALATMLLAPMPAGAAYSPVEADGGGRIHRIGRFGEAGRGRARLFTGLHVLSPEALELLPSGASGVVETVYAPLLARPARVQAAPFDGLWLDLGDPAGYLEAHLTLMGRGLDALPLPARAIDPTAQVDPSAVIVRSAVGPRATVGPGASLEECVVWPDASVAAGERLRRTVVTPALRLGVAGA